MRVRPVYRDGDGKPRRQGKHPLHPEKVLCFPDLSVLSPRAHGALEGDRAREVGGRGFRTEDKQRSRPCGGNGGHVQAPTAFPPGSVVLGTGARRNWLTTPSPSLSPWMAPGFA